MPTLGGTYTTGTASVANGSTAVTGIGVLWNDVLEGDVFIAGGSLMLIGADVVTPYEALTLMKPWPGTTLVAGQYLILRTSWKRYDSNEYQRIIRTLLAQLEATGNYVFVLGAEPDPELGDENQLALKANSGPLKLWQKLSGVWVEIGTLVGTIWSGEWDSGTAYLANATVSRFGSSYIAILPGTNKPPESEPTYWELMVSVGATGYDGGVVTMSMKFSNNLNMADPGDGYLRINTTNQNAGSVIAMDYADANVPPSVFSDVLDNFFNGTSAVRATIRLHKADDTTKFLVFNVTGYNSGVSGHRQFTVVGIGASETSPFINDDPIIFNAVRTGDKGDTVVGPVGPIGPIGAPGGPQSRPFVVDANETTDSDPGLTKLRFGSVPQNASLALRVSTMDALTTAIGPLLANLGVASTSAVKAAGRLFTNGTLANMEFDVTAVSAQVGYYNITIAIKNSSAASPFAHGSTVYFDWVPKGDKGDAATIVIGTTITGAPGTDAIAENVGTPQAFVLNLTVPQGDEGDPFTPVYVVPLLADRDAHDAILAVIGGVRQSVLVESDVDNSNLPTLYFKQSDASGDWSIGFTFNPAGIANAIQYDNAASGLDADEVQSAIDEVVSLVDEIPSPVAMALVLGGI